jgi:hypothetical protein
MEEKKPTHEDMLKAVCTVLDEAMAEADRLTKMSGGIETMQIDDMKGQGKGVVGDGEGSKPLMAKEEDKPKDKEKPEEKEDEEDDEKLKEAYKSLVAKMEKRGLMEKACKPIRKSETEVEAPVVEKTPEVKTEVVDTLRKSVDERFESLTKAIKEVSEVVKKIAATPMPRKGVAWVQALKKSEGSETTLRKSDILGKLLDLKKNGDKQIDSIFINRVETGRVTEADVAKLRSLGLGE